ELGMKGRYDPFFTEDVLEPFPWRETLYTRGQTMWKSFKYLRAHSGFSVEANESREDSLLNHIRELGRWRRSNPWIDVASIDGLERRGSAISYELVGERRIRIFHNFSKEEVEIEGIPLKPYESFIAKG
ncbi:MAG: alpha-amylase, partial [Thermotogae bacterium]